MPRALRPLLALLLAAVVALVVLVAGGPAGPGPATRMEADTGSRPSTRTAADPVGCRRTDRVVDVGLSSTRYPLVREHWDRAIAAGRPRVLTLRREGASRRRSRLLAGVPTRPGEDRDEYPPAAARATVDADVAYVDARQNRGAGSVQGLKLRRYCSGQRFRFVWY
ncbi:NucA/NucB deoxyribonuclease domain-containing protein [Patulibacter sp.]|uniref:NucA/NucB deoxyribonuclease domain-containing protein n=1 Tax=Patulibacter sp. TaxID=1912859 RepID=UPI00271BB72C|nr:NucA/NucB deoxyribonuclease domain-containing protein [Patulibacter sp.]MDO9407654.1 NucA/NucB deoxyribonuclease domain-containing protein [Patulibacter sp.]